MGDKQMLDFDTLVVMFWSNFARACEIEFDVTECVDEARVRGYYQNVQANLSVFQSDAEFLNTALRCSKRAGKSARKLARSLGAGEVKRKHFQAACSELASIRQ